MSDEDLYELAEKINENVLKKTGISNFNLDIMGKLITEEKWNQGSYAVVGFDSKINEAYLKTMSPDGEFDEFMADKIETYLKEKNFKYTRTDYRHFIIEMQKFLLHFCDEFIEVE